MRFAFLAGGTFGLSSRAVFSLCSFFLRAFPFFFFAISVFPSSSSALSLPSSTTVPVASEPGNIFSSVLTVSSTLLTLRRSRRVSQNLAPNSYDRCYSQLVHNKFEA